MKKRIQQHFKKNPYDAKKSRQFAKHFHIRDEEEFQQLRGVLHEMVDTNQLVYTHGRGYHLPKKIHHNTLQGTITVTKEGGTVHTKSGNIFISQKNLHTALDGDTVEVILLGKNKKNKSIIIEGEVVAIIERAPKEFVGTLEQSKNFFFVIPDDNILSRDIYIHQHLLNKAKHGDKVLVQLESWNSEHLNPEGKIIEILGRAGDMSAEIESVIRQFHLSQKFPKEVEHYVAQIPANIPQEEISHRKDLRNTVCFTIDPIDAKDFDDAISIEILENKNYLIGVHIADVSAYVKEGSVLDKEALRRGTSVYLANQVVPMLPEKLSNNLCSLMPNVDRLTYSCFVEITPRGIIKNYEIVRSIINSNKRFTYEDAEKILDEKKGEFATELLQLWSIAEIIKEKRMAHGSIDFDSTEAKFYYDEKGKPTEIFVKRRLKSHQLVEECMLLANKIVAQHIGKNKKGKDVLPFVYRIHDVPNKEKLAELGNFVKKFGYKLNVDGVVSSKEMQKLLETVKGSKEENVINEVALRSMAKAMYSEKNIGHYGLAFEHYTHFTSPIRRYPDLLVHRLLDEYAKGMSHQRQHHYQTMLPEYCKHCSERERVATEAERDSIKVMQVEYMKAHLGDEFEGLIAGVMPYGLFVEINDILVEGLLHIRELGDDYYVFDEKHYSIVGERTDEKFRLGDTIRIKVLRVNPEKRQIDFTLVKEEQKPTSVKKGKRRR